MFKTVNPGSRLELVGSFDFNDPLDMDDCVTDRESGQEVSLGDLLRSFSYDPAETITGPIKIVIEAAP